MANRVLLTAVYPFLNAQQARYIHVLSRSTLDAAHSDLSTLDSMSTTRTNQHCAGLSTLRQLTTTATTATTSTTGTYSAPFTPGSPATEAAPFGVWRDGGARPGAEGGQPKRTDIVQTRILDALNRWVKHDGGTIPCPLPCPASVHVLIPPFRLPASLSPLLCRSFRQLSDRQLRNPDFKRAEELLLACVEDGRPIPPVAITTVLRRTARHKDPLLMENLMKAIQRSGAILSPIHLSCALYHYGGNIHSPGVHACARALGDYPGPVPAALYTRLLTAYLGIGQYDRALRLLGDIRAASGIGASPSPLPASSASTSTGGAAGGAGSAPSAAPPGHSDVGPILWAVLDCLSQSFPIYPRDQFGPVDLQRARYLQVASARARAAAEVLIRHYAVAVQPTTGEANALLSYLCHDPYTSPYLYPGYLTQEGQALRHKAFAMAMLWHRDYGLDPTRSMPEDPSLPVLAEVEAKGARGELEGPPVCVSPSALTPAPAHSTGARKGKKGGAAGEGAGGGDAAELEAYAMSLEETALRGITDDPVRRRAFQGVSSPLSPSSVTGQVLSSDHGEWIGMLGHALACKQIAEAAEPHVLARCMEALAEHLGPNGVSSSASGGAGGGGGGGPKWPGSGGPGGGGNAGKAGGYMAEAAMRRRPVVASDSTPALAPLSLHEVAAGHVSLPYWARDRDPTAVLWAPLAPGTAGPAGFPLLHSNGQSSSSSSKLPLVAVLPDILLRENRLGPGKLPLPPIFPPGEAHLRYIRERSPTVRMALASQGQAGQQLSSLLTPSSSSSPLSSSTPQHRGAERERERGERGERQAGVGVGSSSSVRPGTVSRLTKEEEATRKRLLLLATPMLVGSEQSRIVVLGPGFSSLSPYDYASCWTEAHLLSFAQQGERLTRILAGLFLHLAPMDMAARRADFDMASYPSPTTTASASASASASGGGALPLGGGGGGPGPGQEGQLGPALKLRDGAHEAVFAALAHRQKTVAAAQLAAHSSCVLGGSRLSSPMAVTSLAYGLYHMLPREKALEQIRTLFRSWCGNSLAISTHAALYASTHAFKVGRGGPAAAGGGPPPPPTAAGGGNAAAGSASRQGLGLGSGPGPGAAGGRVGGDASRETHSEGEADVAVAEYGGSGGSSVSSSAYGSSSSTAVLSTNSGGGGSQATTPSWPLPLVQVLLEMEQEARQVAAAAASASKAASVATGARGMQLRDRGADQRGTR